MGFQRRHLCRFDESTPGVVKRHRELQGSATLGARYGHGEAGQGLQNRIPFQHAAGLFEQRDTIRHRRQDYSGRRDIGKPQGAAK